MWTVMSPGTCAPTPETKIKFPYPTVLLNSGGFFALGLRPKTRLVGFSCACAAGTATAVAAAPADSALQKFPSIARAHSYPLPPLPFDTYAVRRSIARRRIRRGPLSPPAYRLALRLRIGIDALPLGRQRALEPQLVAGDGATEIARGEFALVRPFRRPLSCSKTSLCFAEPYMKSSFNSQTPATFDAGPDGCAGGAPSSAASRGRRKGGRPRFSLHRAASGKGLPIPSSRSSRRG